jgi:hypothetical protein
MELRISDLNTQVSIDAARIPLKGNTVFERDGTFLPDNDLEFLLESACKDSRDQRIIGIANGSLSKPEASS